MCVYKQTKDTCNLCIFRYGWISEVDFDDFKDCILKNCYCKEFTKCGVDASTLCDYLNSVDTTLLETYLPAIECNLN